MRAHWGCRWSQCLHDRALLLPGPLTKDLLPAQQQKPRANLQTAGDMHLGSLAEGPTPSQHAPEQAIIAERVPQAVQW